MYIGEIVRPIFAKIASAKQFLWFLMLKNTPAKRKNIWGNHKCFCSTFITITVAVAVASATVTAAAKNFLVTPGTFPFRWSVLYC